jgi:hypothetical protein
MAVITKVLPVPTTTPHRLGRHYEYDERSRNFEFRGPRRGIQQDKLWSFSQPVLNQGETSSCVGNTYSQFINSDYCDPTRKKLNIEWVTETQALECYHLATIADGVSDQVYPPNDDGTSSLGGAKAAQQLGWIDRYEHAFDFGTFQSAIQTQPVCVGTLWTNEMFNIDSTGLITVGPLGDVNDPDNQYIAGGHEYLGLGISYTLRQVRFLTSWGSSFGPLNGEFKMSFNDFETLIENQGDIVVAHGVAQP